MALSPVSVSAGSVAATNSTTITLGATVTAGNFVIIFAARSGGTSTGALTGVTDSASQTWTLATTGSVSGGTNTRIECWYTWNSAAITSVTLNSSTSQFYAWDFTEWLGGAGGVLSSGNPLDVASTNPSGLASTTAIVTPSLTTLNANDLAFAAMTASTATITANAAGGSPTSGWTDQNQFGLSGTSNGSMAFAQFTSTGSYDRAWTLGTAHAAGIITVAFQLTPAATLPKPLILSQAVKRQAFR